jgi:hypothetical protein
VSELLLQCSVQSRVLKGGANRAVRRPTAEDRDGIEPAVDGCGLLEGLPEVGDANCRRPANEDVVGSVGHPAAGSARDS